MNKFRIRLFIVIFSLISIVLLSLGLMMGQLFKEFHAEQIFAGLKKEAGIVKEKLVQEIVTGGNIAKFAEEIGEQFGVRVTVMAADGTVLADTAIAPETMENHFQRPEIQNAIYGKERYVVRYSETQGENGLYYATALTDEDGNEIGFLRLSVPMKQFSDVYQKMWSAIIASFFIAFIIIVILINRITARMFQPMEEMKNVIYSLASGDYHVRMAGNSHGEFGELSRSLNTLAQKIGQVTERHERQKERLETLIENMGSGLILMNPRGDITLINEACKTIFAENTDEWLNRLYYDCIKHKELVRFIQHLFMTEQPERRQVPMTIQFETHYFDVYGAPVMSREGILNGIVLVFHDITELKKLEKIRKDFVANVSHELRTPVTSIRGFSETLLDGALKDEVLCEKFLKIIYKESERLQNLINDLLELSRLEQSEFQLNLEEAPLFEIVDDVVELLKNKVEEKDLEMNVFVSGNTNLWMDVQRMKQVVINLISNAIMYTPNGGKISIGVNEKEDNVELVVSDTGIGIPEEELPRIFERFYRIDKARSRNSGGTGLGLAIVKHIVDVHHGKIAVDSVVGKGTTFTITLPKKLKSEEEI